MKCSFDILKAFLTLSVIVGSLPNNIQNGQQEDAVPVMANFNWLMNQVNLNAAENGLNASITQLTGLTTPLTVAQGGTGSNSAANARIALGVNDANGINASITQITNLQNQTFRNRLINGDMAVSQVNGTTAVTPTVTDTYPIDQWKVDATQASKLTFQQVVDAPVGLKYSTKITVAAQYAPLATDRFGIYQPVEGQNIIDFGLGTASPATIALSLWIKGSVTGTYACGFNNAGTRSYVGTISVTASWAKQTVVLVADNTGTWPTDNTNGGQFYIDLGSGTNFNTTSGAWQAGDFTRTTGTVTFVNQAAASTLNITGCQLEAIPTGATAGTAFEFLPYETQLRRCQRYLPYFASASSVTTLGAGFTNGTTGAIGVVPFVVPTRVVVTGLVFSNATHFTFQNSTGFPASAVSIVQPSLTTSAILLTIAGATANQGGDVAFNTISGWIYFTGAQL